MKQVILAAFLSAGVLLLNAQNADSIPEPEFINQVFAWGKDHKMTPLEKTSAKIVTKNKMGIGGAKQLYEIDGDRSEVAVNPGEVMFVVGTGGGGGFGMDPTTQFALIRLDASKGKRQATYADYGGMGKKGKTDPGSNEIGLNFKKVREGVFGIVPEKQLEKGQYAFLSKMSMQASGTSMKMDAFAFAVE